MVQLPYVDSLSLSTSNLSSAFGTETSFRLNSLFDPYFSAGGHQPYGFDQITPFYEFYQVTRADITITFSDPSADGVIVGAYLKNYYDSQTLQGATISQAEERPQNWVRNLNNTGSQNVTFTKSVDLAAMTGLTPTQYMSSWPAYGARVTADPSYTPYLSVAVSDAQATGTKTVTARVRITYTAVFFGRNTVAQS